MEQKVISINRKIFHSFDILENYEAGIVLKGCEVKSIREGKIDIKDAFCLIENGEIWLLNCRIPLYEKTSYVKLEPDRKRKLLLHKSEIKRLLGKTSQKGLVVKPLKVYLNNNGIVKLELVLCKYKKVYDRREEIKQRELTRDLQKYQKGKYN